jgi:TonB-linked SusC/RagA family outer membrane protein
LDEVVVVGYGSVRKRDLTGSVSTVGADKLKNRSFGNALQSMAGQVSGIQITQTQGAPGMAPTIKVRGATSINAGTTPLYVIDGVPLEDDTNSGDGTNGGSLQYSNHNPMNNINPNDIESIEVLKDAASAAIYGSRGANGVVLITTKQGKAGKTKVDLTYELGISRVNRRLDMMDATQWIEYETAARQNQWATDYAKNPSITPKNATHVVPTEFSDPEWLARIGNGTDWQDVLYRTGISHNVQASVSGGSENTQFMVSLGYLNQEGVVITNDYDRISLRSNINHKINKRLNIAVKVNLTRSNDSPQGLAGKSDVVSLACQSDPIFPLYVETGSLGFKDPDSMWNTFVKYGFQLWHPYSLTYEASKKLKTDNILGNVSADYKILDGLTFKTSAGMNTSDSHYEYYWNEGQNWGYSGWVAATGTYATRRVDNWVWENTLNYNKTFNEDHNVTALIGYTMQDQKTTYATITGNGYPNDMVHTINASTSQKASSTKSEWSLISYLARATYSYKGKYLASASIRADGCSRFGSDNRWGYFPSVSAAWRMSEESFLKNVEWLDNLKVRLSYGVTGNNQIDDYASIGLLSTSQYAINGTLTNGLYTSTLPSKDLKWEKTGQYDFGVDAGFFNNRLTVGFDLYYSKTTDMLLKVPVPVLTGFTESQTNVGSVENKGVEFNFSSVNIKGKDFTWSSDFNISANRNKVLHLGNNDAPIDVSTNSAISRTEVGQPVGNYYGYKVIGVYSTAEINDPTVAKYSGAEPGDPKVEDVDGNGVINTSDRTILGNYQPDFTWGFTNNFSYKGVELSVMLTGTQGNEIMNQNARFLGFYNGARNLYASRSNFWKSDDDPGDGMTPKPRTTPNTIESNSSSLWVEDGSFVRIKNIRIGYNFPKSITKKLGVGNIKLYCNMENVHVFSDYSNYDPEGSTFQTGYRVGYDYGAYPNPFTCTFGLNVGF